MTKTNLLGTCLAQPAGLSELVDYSNDSIVSKTVIDKPVGTITLFAFDKGQQLSEHTVPYDAVVQVTDGCGTIYINGKENILTSGQIIIMPANVPHSVSAHEKFKMMLIMIRE